MNNKVVNIRMVGEVAKALQDLRPKMVFVGGAVISLYTDDPAADEVRPTSDIDLTIQLTGYKEWTKIQGRFLELGFLPDPEGHSICSYLYKKISVDIMPSEDGPIGPSNRWYKPGFDYLLEVSVEDEKIYILSPPYFLAAKFEAFQSRGGDYRTSYDFEDIIYVVDNQINIVDVIQNADDKVKSFLQQEFRKIIDNPYADEIIRAQIHPILAEDRFPIVLNKINAIIS
jgi:hypothetical protein